MLETNQKGFSPIIIILIVLVLLVTGWMSFSGFMTRLNTSKIPSSQDRIYESNPGQIDVLQTIKEKVFLKSETPNAQEEKEVLSPSPASSSASSSASSPTPTSTPSVVPGSSTSNSTVVPAPTSVPIASPKSAFERLKDRVDETSDWQPVYSLD